MRKLGVNRISFGVQSFHTNKLKALNRAHTPTQAKNAIHTAKELGFSHLSLDLIYNYQGDTETLLGKDIEMAFSLPINHISTYELTIENGTVFSATPHVRQENESLAFFVAEQIKARGFEHYEISNFGTYQSRHNKGYWKLKEYIGAGAGAVGFRYKPQLNKPSNDSIIATRYYPQTHIESYITNPTNITEENLTEEEIITEKVFLGLRSNIGIEKHILTPLMQAHALTLLEEGKLREDALRYYSRDFFIADSLALYILE